MVYYQTSIDIQMIYFRSKHIFIPNIRATLELRVGCFPRPERLFGASYCLNCVKCNLINIWT